MKRYLVFAGDEHYPLGGFRDFIGAGNNREEILEILDIADRDWWHVVDSTNGKIFNTLEKVDSL